MSLTLADGSALAIASTYGPSVAMSVLTNATEAVGTFAAAHGVVVGEYFEVTSGWPLLTGKIIRAKTVATNDVTFENFNSSNTTNFPAGTGIGTIRRITAWQALAQITDVQVDGGAQEYYKYQFLDQLQQKNLPTSKSPIVIALVMADDISLAQVAIIRAAEAGATPVALRLVYRNNTRTVANGYWSYASFPGLKLGEANTRAIGFALAADATEYAT